MQKYQAYIKGMEEKKIYTIYGYYQPAENKWYVGRTCRSKSHRAGKNGKRYLILHKFGESILKYGWDSFDYYVLDITTDLAESYKLEQYWIAQKDSINNGYNTSKGGISGAYGATWRYPHPFSEEHKQKLSESNTGKKATDETKERLSQSLKGTPHPWKEKKIKQFTKDGQFIAEYSSAVEASRRTGIYLTNIRHCLYGIRKTSGGFVWEYA